MTNIERAAAKAIAEATADEESLKVPGGDDVLEALGLLIERVCAPVAEACQVDMTPEGQRYAARLLRRAAAWALAASVTLDGEALKTHRASRN